MNARLRRLVSFATIALQLTASPALRAADGSVSFDGTGQCVFVPQFNKAGVSGEVTVEFWAKTNAVGQQAAFMLTPDQPANRFQASISYNSGGNTNTYWDCGDITGTGAGRLSTPNPAGTVGNWTHYAFVSSASGGFMKIYVNGVEVASKTGTVSAFNPAGNNPNVYGLYIGGGDGYSLNGSLDEFRVWNTVRTQWEIQRDCGATLTGSEAGLQLYYKFDEGSGNLAVNSAKATGTTFDGGLFNGTTRSGPARLTVSNTNNSGTGSLRQAVVDAAAAPGASYITFDPTLSGQTITLNSEITVIDATGPVTIDASSLPGGLTLDGSGGATAHAIFKVYNFLLSNNTHLILHCLTLTGGKNGAIYNLGDLTLTRCTLFGNSGSPNSGGAIYSQDGAVTLTHCTLSGNASDGSGGAIYSGYGTLALTHCTLTGNTAASSGGISGTATLTNCIVAGNTDGTAGTATDNISGAFTGSNNLTTGNPQLSPLGYYGGSTMTMRPMLGSPAIDKGKVIAGLSTDQRGFARNVDGNGAGGAQPDIGAVELNPVTVTTTADEDDTPAGTNISLREAVRSQADVFFAPALSGQTIGLTEGTEIVLNQSVSIDASSLPAGLTVDGISSTGDNRLFTVSADQSVSMTGLTLTGGKGVGAIFSGNGGAVLNLGALSMTRCLIYGNQATDSGGALQNQGTLRLKACSLVHNSASNYGGGLYNASVASLTQCTVAANTSNGIGGGICNTGSFFIPIDVILTLEHCTIATNTAKEAGGILNDVSATIKIAQTVVAGNTAVSSPEFLNNARVVASGASGVQGPFYSSLPGSGTVKQDNIFSIGFDPNITLGQLGYYGGGMPTMPPKAGSPLIDASFGSTITTDQRGFPIVGKPDIGAAERQGTETLTVTTTADEVDSLFKMETSLREAITDGAAENIVFAPALSGGTITLESTRGEIGITRGVSLDATSLPKGLTLDGGIGLNRIFNITSAARVDIKGLTLTGGDVGSGAGGAILGGGSATLALERCTFTGNNALEGGAIFTSTSQFLFLDRCTFSGNTGGYGGALQCLGETGITHCTISANHGSVVSGGIFNKFTTTAKPLLIRDSIIAGNSSPWSEGDDIFTLSGVIWMLDANIVVSRYEDSSSSVRSGSTTPLTSDPLLAPLRDYGGPTKTMALKPGSPARDAALQRNTTTDQRGFPLVGVADIGAYEAGTISIYNSWTWEIHGQALLPNDDNDKDGNTNLMEYAAETNPFTYNASPVIPPSPNTGVGGLSTFAAAALPQVLSYDSAFRYNPEATDLRYTFQRGSDLSPTGWTTIYTYDSTTGVISETSGVIGDKVPASNLIYITDSAFYPGRTFWRLGVEQK